MRRGVLLALAGLALFAGGTASGWLAHAPKLDVRLYAQNRFAVVQQHLEEADPGYVLLAGDSQAELQSPSGRVCGASLVNAGLSGATSTAYAELFPSLSFPVRPGAAVLTIGTNDLNAKNDPRSPAALARYDANVSALVTRLKVLTENVLVTALPPLGRELAGRFDGDLTVLYSDRIAALCPRIGCRFVDPFAEFRDGRSGHGLPGATRNGLHLARYRPALAQLSAAICPERAGR